MAGGLERKPEEVAEHASDVGHVSDKGRGLTVPRYFTRAVATGAGVDPMSEVEWELRSAVIAGEDGRVVFEQQNVEVPRAWSQTATNVVVSKYFRGPLGTEKDRAFAGPKRETSVRQLIGRVVDTVTGWGEKQSYFRTAEDRDAFRAELTCLLVSQKASFNSPVYFNVGIDPKPQCSACFILKVEDNMESILGWYRNEGMIFKGGSGSGVNLSALRSCREKLSSGGTASGPLSFMKAADASAGVIKSGGKTRRAAKMVVLNAEHPDIELFIKCKQAEERKAWALIEAGYDASLDGDAYGSVFFQNANNSVRVSDEFMQAVLNDGEWQTRFVKSGEVAETLRAQDLMRTIAEATHACGDPGMQFDTTINLWHTCPASGRINASNPCSEYMHLDNSACNLASLNLLKFLDERGEFDVKAFRHAVADFLLELHQPFGLASGRQLLQMRRTVRVDTQFTVVRESGINLGCHLRQFVLQRSGEVLSACRDAEGSAVGWQPLLALRPGEELSTVVGKVFGADDVDIASLQGIRQMDEDADLKRPSIEGARSGSAFANKALPPLGSKAEIDSIGQFMPSCVPVLADDRQGIKQTVILCCRLDVHEIEQAEQ